MDDIFDGWITENQKKMILELMEKEKSMDGKPGQNFKLYNKVVAKLTEMFEGQAEVEAKIPTKIHGPGYITIKSDYIAFNLSELMEFVNTVGMCTAFDIEADNGIVEISMTIPYVMQCAD